MLSREERVLAAQAERCAKRVRRQMMESIRSGADPLGEIFCGLRTSRVRRGLGATYTPLAIVGAMLDRAAERSKPASVVDPGCGSGRFLVCAGQKFQRARLVGVEIDPLAALLARAHVTAGGMARRAAVLLGDYCQIQLPFREGNRLFLGNPPYVRHHELSARSKNWLVRTAKKYGLAASRLAGLHLHFLLATLEHAQPGDHGALITAAEWFDVNYGSLARRLLAGPLGAYCVQRGNPREAAFPDAQSTAAISYFAVGSSHADVQLEQLVDWQSPWQVSGSARVGRSELAEAPRWSAWLAPQRAERGSSILADWFEIHRGVATGMNRAWLRDEPLPGELRRYCQRCVTGAREILAAGNGVLEVDRLRWIVDLPVDLDCLVGESKKRAEQLLREWKDAGADLSYLARHRTPWWCLRLREPAPILVTYMARRPPRFVLNPRGARHLNIAHGLYPRKTMGQQNLRAWVDYLNGAVDAGAGRQYAGGLCKFEPGDLARLSVEPPQSVVRDRPLAVG
jgi:methylase of polypeptide subunit release factors